jgi:mannitol/fructose-specific phosphotransferase system IIA component (Ntr-type)
MKLCDLLTDSVIAVKLRAEDKGNLLVGLVDLATNGERVKDKQEALSAVEERERIMTTAIGYGVAIPHGKTSAVDELVAAFAVLDEGIEFGALDGQEIRLAFLLLGPKEPSGPHIRMLSRISRLMSREELRSKLLATETPEEVRDLFREAEQDMFDI